ncbi:hypothetical protein [Streptomyces sp. NRRL WC-3725]|uniref:hypothetical protein n=1 Tax=Streptomyces sp. NRRL WC-3725 TaxID=1463933 RepID=UPI0004C92F16|nr:hypothetical protein [Streptomyces sp. NRRL WC-3725]
MAAYLSQHCDSPEPLDRLLARAALSHKPDPDGLLDVERFLARARTSPAPASAPCYTPYLAVQRSAECGRP